MSGKWRKHAVIMSNWCFPLNFVNGTYPQNVCYWTLSYYSYYLTLRSVLFRTQLLSHTDHLNGSDGPWKQLSRVYISADTRYSMPKTNSKLSVILEDWYYSLPLSHYLPSVTLLSPYCTSDFTKCDLRMWIEFVCLLFVC